MSSINLQLKKFDIANISKGSNVLIYGKKNTGKSWITRDIMYHLRDIPTGVVISPTEMSNGFFSKFVPKIFIYEEYHPSIIANLVKRQEKLARRIENGENLDKNVYLVLDDCLYDKSWQNDKNIRKIIMNGRHLGISFLFTAQYLMIINTYIRSNSDYIFILKENLIVNRKRIYENMAGMCRTFEMFCSILDQCTENHECLVIDNKTQSNKIEDMIFWYRAQPREFKMGPPEIWNYAEENYQEDDSEDEIDINTYNETRKGPKLNVKKV